MKVNFLIYFHIIDILFHFNIIKVKGEIKFRIVGVEKHVGKIVY